MARYRVSGDVRLAFVHEIDAKSEEDARLIVEALSWKDLQNVDRSSGTAFIEAQDSEEIE